MMQTSAERLIKAYIAAMHRLADPHRAVLHASAPIMVTGGEPFRNSSLCSG